MRIFAPEDVSAKSRYWYFMSKLRKLKKANGEIVSITEVWSALGTPRALFNTPQASLVILLLPTVYVGSTEVTNQDQERWHLATL